jgi:hypothetical protein
MSQSEELAAPQRGVRRRKSSMLLLLSAAVTLAILACELMARFVVPDGCKGALLERQAFLLKLPAQAEDGKLVRTNPTVARAYGAGFVLHPFFGYTFTHGASGANNQGFFSAGPGDGPPYPYRKAPREFVIGLFGASVAMQVAAAPNLLLERLRPALALKGYDRVTLLSFAVGGWRQPQSFYALVYFLETIDAAIVLDGFNEVIQLSDWHLQQQPAAFPWSEVYLTLARTPSSRETLQRAELIRARREAARLTRWLDVPVVRSSALAYLIWKAFIRRYERRVTKLREGAPTNDWNAMEPATTSTAIAAKRLRYMQFWANLIRFSDVIARRQGKQFFHFVQPNQYERDSKPLSEEERALYIKNDWFDAVTTGYREIESMTTELRAEGIESHFLGHVFADTSQTVYMDDCCHLNAAGVEILSAAIADRIISSGALARVASIGSSREATPAQ